MNRLLVLVSLLAAVGCKRAQGGPSRVVGDPTGGNASADHDGTAGDAGADLSAYEACIVGAGACGVDLECVSLSGGPGGLCLQGCSPGGGACPGGEVCLPSSGRLGSSCFRTVGYWEPCSAAYVCGTSAFCAGAAGVQRCVPICDVGSLGGFTSVSPCPNPPAALSDQPATCTTLVLGSGSAGFCLAEATLGGLCDGFGLACNANDARPDTDPLLEGVSDPGALACVPVGASHECRRFCSNDGGVTQAPCACPAGDPACADPVDPNLLWECVRWPDLAPGLFACMPIERCVGASDCADNVVSGLTACGSSRFEGISETICQRP